MADKQEKDLDQASDCAWVRGLDANGNPIRISKADLDRTIKDVNKIRMPNISTKAAMICRIHIPIGSYNASVFVRIDAFQLSCFGVIGVYVAGDSVVPFAKLNGFILTEMANILFERDGEVITVYITGNYNSLYNSFFSEAISTCENISFDTANHIVEASSINVMKSINIADAMS